MNFLNMLPVLKRGKRTYGISKNTPYTRGRMIIPFCNSFDDTLDFIRESQRNEKYHIYLKRVTGLYVDRIMKQRFQGVNIYERNKLKEVYEKSQERCPELGLFYRNLRQYNGRNLVYDVSKFIDTFYKRTNNKWSLREQLFKEYISPKVFNDQYPDTVIIIPINKGDDYKKGQIIKTNRNEKKIWFAFLTLIKEANDIDELIELFGDTDIVVTSQRGLYKINFKTIKEEMNMSIKDIMTQIIRLTRVIVPSSNESVNKTAVVDKLDEEDIEELDIEDEEDDSETNNNENNISKRKQEIISKLSDDDDNEEIIEAVEKASEIISEDKDLEDVAKILLEVNDLKMGQVSNISSKERNYLKNTMNVSINERDFEDILDNIEDLTIEESSFDTTSLDEFNKNSFINFNKTYDKKLKDYDIGNIAQAFSETDIPLYVQDVSIEESSDDLDYKETVKMKFKDAEGKQHNVKVDLPKMIDNKFLYLGGSKKALISQIVPNPITKIDDRVIITTNYNKLFLNYKGGKYLNPNHSILKRAVEKNKDRGVEEIQDGITFGNLYEENFKEGETTREYNEVSRQIARVKNDDLNISFNLNKMKEDNPDFFEEQEKVNGRYEKILIGQIDGEDVIYDTTDEVISSPDDYEGLTLIDLLLKIFKERDFDIIKEDIESINTVPKTIRHSSLYILGKDTPLILILIYLEGLQYVMDKIDLDYKIIPKDEDTSKPRIDKFNEARLEFKDAYLVYQLDDLASTSLMSYLNKMELEDFSLTDLEDKNKSVSILIEESGSHNFPLYIDNYNNLMIDPITRDVLMRFSLPTEFSDVLIYSNYLLSTGENADDKDIKNSRIRSEELITASLYNVLAEQYEDFSAKKKRGSSNAEFSIPKDKVIKEIFDLPNIQEYSTINPIREIDKYSSASFKGLRGINEDRAYTADKRLYDPSFYGKFSPVSSYSGSIGVTKHMAVDPMIKSARGFMENVDLEDVDDLDSKRILTASEALTTDVGNRDDSPRKAIN